MNPILKMLRKDNDVKIAKFLYQQHVDALEILRLKQENITLKEQLDIVIKALKKYESAAGWGREAFLALKEMEGVK